MFYFNPRSRVGNDILSIKFARTTLTFQSTFPRGERRKTIDNVKAEEKFQSTFPRGERQGVSLTALISGNFNPRSRVGNDGRPLIMSKQKKNFNPRSRVGNDYNKGGDTPIYGISIHVPAWGTTQNLFSLTLLLLFQSTFPRGERLLRGDRICPDSIFQSTFPRGERQQKHINFPYLFTHFCIN